MNKILNKPIGVKVERPAHISEERWAQHQQWVDVMDKQVADNIKQRPASLFKGTDNVDKSSKETQKKAATEK